MCRRPGATHPPADATAVCSCSASTNRAEKYLSATARSRRCSSPCMRMSMSTSYARRCVRYRDRYEMHAKLLQLTRVLFCVCVCVATSSGRASAPVQLSASQAACKTQAARRWNNTQQSNEHPPTHQQRRTLQISNPSARKPECDTKLRGFLSLIRKVTEEDNADIASCSSIYYKTFVSDRLGDE